MQCACRSCRPDQKAPVQEYSTCLLLYATSVCRLVSTEPLTGSLPRTLKGSITTSLYSQCEFPTNIDWIELLEEVSCKLRTKVAWYARPAQDTLKTQSLPHVSRPHLCRLNSTLYIKTSAQIRTYEVKNSSSCRTAVIRTDARTSCWNAQAKHNWYVEVKPVPKEVTRTVSRLTEGLGVIELAEDVCWK